MSDLSAGPASGRVREGGGDPWNGGPFPPVLLAALGAAAMIAVMLLALFGRFGGGEEDAAPALDSQAPPAAAQPEQRVELMVTLQGSGEGEIRIMPGDISCRRSCAHEFERGTRVTVTADAASRSTFEGWGDSCDGTTRCSIVMHGERALTARFDTKPDEPLCLEGEQGCPDADRRADDDLEAPDADLEELDELDDAPAPGPDCADGRDNDRDGLTDSAQDPDCDRGSEAGSGAARGTPAPPPRATPAGDCADGRDNDRDGLTDRAQDPNCLSGDTEAG